MAESDVDELVRSIAALTARWEAAGAAHHAGESAVEQVLEALDTILGGERSAEWEWRRSLQNAHASEVALAHQVGKLLRCLASVWPQRFVVTLPKSVFVGSFPVTNIDTHFRHAPPRT